MGLEDDLYDELYELRETLRQERKMSNGRIPNVCSDEALREKLEGLEGKEGSIVSLTSQELVDKAPLAYDLTELQRDANTMLGFSAKETLDTLQRLYEVHKIVT